MKVLIVAQISNNEATVATLRRLLLLRAGGWGSGDFQKGDQEKSSSPLGSQKRTLQLWSKRGHIAAHSGVILPRLKTRVSHFQMSLNLSRSHMHGQAHTQPDKQHTNAARKHKAKSMSPVLCRIESICKASSSRSRRRAQAPARSPRVARVTLGLLPCHSLDHKCPLLSSGRWQPCS